MRWLAALLLLLAAPALAQTAIRPDQISPGTPNITWLPGGTGYQIGSTVPWRTDTTATSSPPDFTVNDLAKVIELTNTGAITKVLPAASGSFGDGAGFTLQIGAGTLTLTAPAGTAISGSTTGIVAGPYVSVNLLSKAANWYAAVSVRPTAAVAAPTGATWDPSAKGAGVTLSSSNLVATGATGFQSVRSTTSKSTGKVYFELGCDVIAADAGWLGGLENASGSLTSHAGSTTNGFGAQSDTGTGGMNFFYNGGSVKNVTGTVCTSSASNRVHFAFDITGAKFYVQVYAGGPGGGSGKWNNNIESVPSTDPYNVLATGPFFIAWSGTATNAARLYANTSTIEGPVPTGYTVWDSAP